MSESERLSAVRELRLIGSAPEREFDRLARLVGHVLDASHSHICFLDDKQQFIKAQDGILLPTAMPIENSICGRLITLQQRLVIEDLSGSNEPNASRLANLGFSSYVGMPIKMPGGHVVGAMAAFRPFGRPTHAQLAALDDLAEVAVRELLIRKAVLSGRKDTARALVRTPDQDPLDGSRHNAWSNLHVLKSIKDGVIALRGDGQIAYINPAAEQLLGLSSQLVLHRTFSSTIQGARLDGVKRCAAEETLHDGVERLVQKDVFRRANGGDLIVEYVVTPVMSDSRPIAALLVFRETPASGQSNGVALHNSFKEIARLKEKIAKLEAKTADTGRMARLSIPALNSGSRPSFASLLELIRKEQADQNVRLEALQIEHNPQEWTQSAAPGRRSRIERWTATDGRVPSPEQVAKTPEKITRYIGLAPI